MFHSTNYDTKAVDFKTAILKGQALDKGLYMLNEIPELDQEEIYHFKKQSLNEIAFTVLSKIIGDSIPEKNLRNLINDALNFKVPIKSIFKNDFICYLDKGPTCSFKDFGARILARMMEYYLKKENRNIIILTATSGDTGGAVAQAFYEMSHLKVVILFPESEVSELQRKQMTTLDKNIIAIVIDGKFDDCQKYVKTAFADDDFENLNLSSANSINFGRLMPQTLYYFYSYSRIIDKKEEKIIFSVPSGNFGNLMGGLIAHRMGLPVEHFIVAVNENDEFPKFLKTGTYEKVKPSKNCISNAMNVGHPSNLARVVDLYGGIMDENGQIHKKPDMEKMREKIISYSISDKMTKQTIEDFYRNFNEIIEPHGAVGWKALKLYRKEFPHNKEIKSVTFETADPAKFPEEIINLISVTPKMPKTLKQIQSQNEIPDNIHLQNYIDFKSFLLKGFHSHN